MRASPNFDVTFNLNGGGSVNFPGLAIYQNADPVQGDSPKTLKLFGDAFSVSRAKWDNVEFGTLIPEPATMVLLGLGFAAVRIFRRVG